MDAQDLSYYIKDELLPKRKNTTQSLVIETSEPVFTRFSRRKAKSKHTFKMVFQQGSRIYVNSRTSTKGWEIINVFGRDAEFVNAYWKESGNKKAKPTYQDVLNRRFDAITWKELTTEFLKKPAGLSNPKIRYITGSFSKSDTEKIKNAFEKKKDISIRVSGERRDLSVETRWDAENENFRAWFSSEYAGTLNGDYYLLLNPTMAVFYESD